jgi:hypothetical protein
MFDLVETFVSSQLRGNARFLRRHVLFSPWMELKFQSGAFGRGLRKVECWFLPSPAIVSELLNSALS